MPRNHLPGASTLRNRNRVTNKTRLKIHHGNFEAETIFIPDEDEEKHRLTNLVAGVDAEDANVSLACPPLFYPDSTSPIFVAVCSAAQMTNLNHVRLIGAPPSRGPYTSVQGRCPRRRYQRPCRQHGTCRIYPHTGLCWYRRQLS